MSDGPHANERSGHWRDIGRMWSLVGAPLRPGPEDVAFVESELEGRDGTAGPPRALILGVTPELYHASWPAGASVMAVDHTRGMIDAIWPGPRDDVLCAEWTSIPLPDASRDMALCDGGFHLLGHPDGQRALVGELRRLISPGGLCVVRLFIPPPVAERPDDVLEDMEQGRIPSINVLKLRLGMALQKDAAEGVGVDEVWDRLHAVAPDLEELAERIGWPVDETLVINTYRGSPNRYYFVTVDQVRDLFCGDGFEFERLHVPDYTLGERCPTVVFRRR